MSLPSPDIPFNLPTLPTLIDDQSSQCFLQVEPGTFRPTSNSNNNFATTTHWANTSFQVNQYLQRIQGLEEMNTRLRIQNAATESARSTLDRQSYNALIARLNPSTTSNGASSTVNIALQPSASESFLAATPLSKLRGEEYPLVRFWTEKKWQEWKQTPTGHATTSKHSYLEDEIGQQLSDSRVSAITTNMRDIWHEFHKRQIITANATWTSMPLIAKKAFRAEIAQAFPELNLGEDAWKIDRLAKQTYPSYKQTWITNKSDEKASAGKHKMKIETDPGDASSNHDHSSRDAKRQKIEPETDSGDEAANHDHTRCRDAKCQKAEDHDAALQFITNTPLGQPSEQETSTPVFDIDSAESTSPFSGGPTSHRGNMYMEVTDISSKSSSHSEDGVMVSFPGSRPNSRPSTSSDQLMPSAAQPTLDDPEAIPLLESKLIKPKNPLAMMPRKLSMVQSASESQPVASSPPGETPLRSEESVVVGPSRTVTNAQTEVTAAASSSKPSEAAAPGGTQSKAVPKKGGVSWRPPSAKTGRTLCAHRWLKQVKPDGTREEFGTYYDALSAQLKAKYKDEATKLVTEGIWTNGTAETITKIAFLDMYN